MDQLETGYVLFSVSGSVSSSGRIFRLLKMTGTVKLLAD